MDFYFFCEFSNLLSPECGSVEDRDCIFVVFLISNTIIITILSNFIYLWLFWVFSAAQGFALVLARGLLIVVASLVVEHGL